MSVFDFDGFLALEQMAEKRKALESFCRLHAPIGILDRFIEYEAKILNAVVGPVLIESTASASSGKVIVLSSNMRRRS